jgi:hypothetical protein
MSEVRLNARQANAVRVIQEWQCGKLPYWDDVFWGAGLYAEEHRDLYFRVGRQTTPEQLREIVKEVVQ